MALRVIFCNVPLFAINFTCLIKHLNLTILPNIQIAISFQWKNNDKNDNFKSL